MRIITGEFKGRRIATPKTRSVRPTTNRVKESMFNIIENIHPCDGTTCLDLFAGGGNLGIEALSRGASHVTFVDSTRGCIATLKDNIALLDIASRSTVIYADVRRCLPKLHAQYDIIIIDPPYAYPEYDYVQRDVAQLQLLREGGLVVVQHLNKKVLKYEPEWTRIDHRTFGETHVSFFHPTHGVQ